MTRSAGLGLALEASGIKNGQAQGGNIAAAALPASGITHRPVQVANINTGRLAVTAASASMIRLAQAANIDVVRVPVQAASVIMIEAAMVVNGAAASRLLVRAARSTMTAQVRAVIARSTTPISQSGVSEILAAKQAWVAELPSMLNLKLRLAAAAAVSGGGIAAKLAAAAVPTKVVRLVTMSQQLEAAAEP